MALSTFFTTLLLPSTSPLSLPKTSSSRSRSRSHCSPVIAATASPPCLTASSASASVCVSDISSWVAIAYPAMAYSTTLYFKPGYFNVEVIPNDNEPEDRLIHRFRKEVLKADVLQECRRRRFFENKQEKKKRKARDASRKNRKWKPQARAPPQKKHEAPNKKKDDDDKDDTWELPDVDPPYCRSSNKETNSKKK